jgi:wobble nucleotide-excising tRNase
MLRRIIKIEKIGLFCQTSTHRGQLEKVTLVFGENGRGKSTLAALLRSCSSGDVSEMTSRVTIDSPGTPDAELLFEHGPKKVTTKLSASGWTVKNPDIVVFDSDFIEKNVYSGASVGPDHRQNLLEVALGSRAVSEKLAVEEATKQSTKHSQDIAAAERVLAARVEGMALAAFRKLQPVADVDSAIQNVQARIVAAKQIAALQSMQMPAKATGPTFDVEAFFAILTRTLEAIGEDSERIVAAHIAKHKDAAFENWLSVGTKHDDGATCPYCGQSTSGVALVRSFRTHFNRAYKEHQSNVDILVRGLESRLGDGALERLFASLSAAQTSIAAWRTHIPTLEFAYNEAGLRLRLTTFRDRLSALAASKQARPMEAVGGNLLSTVVDAWNQIQADVDLTNSAVDNATKQIAAYKSGLAAENIGALEKRVVELRNAKVRHSPPVVAELTKLDSLEVAKKNAEKDKVEAKKRLDQVLETTLAGLQGRLNGLLAKFGAAFTVEGLRHDYRAAGRPRSDYALRLRNKDVQLSGASGPTFSNALSEGDRRTLAFAFFVATLQADPLIGEKIVVIDDPICSLDQNRRTASRRAVREIAGLAKQTVVLAHDSYFLRDLQDDLVDPKAPSGVATVKLQRGTSGYTEFGSLNLEEQCSSDYYRNHKLVSDSQSMAIVEAELLSYQARTQRDAQAP